MGKIRFKDGLEMEEGIVLAVKLGVRSIIEKENPIDQAILLCELREKCENPNHEFYADSEEKLKQHGLIQSVGIHNDVRKIVLSAIREENGEMTWEFPI